MSSVQLADSTKNRTPSTNRQSRVPSEFRPLVRGVIWVLVLTAIVPTKAEPDLWGNLRFGLDLLASWSFATVDPYSFTQDIPWVNHSWLPQILLAAAFSAAGSVGVVVLKVIVVAIGLWLVAGAFEGSRALVPEAAVIAVLIPGIALFTTARAQLWTFLGLVVLCRLILARDPRRMVWVPLLFVVWVNSHVGWVTGLAILVWWTIGCVVRGPQRQRLYAVGILSAAVLATLVNPYGWRMWRFVWGVAHLSRDISEWQPLWAAPILQLVAFLACLTVVIVLVVVGRARVPFERLASIAGLAYAALRAVKFNSLFVAVSALFLAPAIVERFPRRPADDRPLAAGIRLINGVILALLLTVATINAWPNIRCLDSGDWRPDPIAARALLDAQPAGRIVVAFDWGEYVIWHFGPQLRVSYDPRYDLVYSSHTIAEQDAVDGARPEGLAFLQRARPEYVWFRQSSQHLKSWLQSNGYRLDIDTSESFIGVRQDLPQLQDPGPQTFGCFPSP